jgi:SPP1 gp7 family putative phage head morphogenesis protein
MSNALATYPVVDLALKFRQAVLKRDTAALMRLAVTYNNIYLDIKPRIDNLLHILTTEEALTKGQITRLAQYKDLIDAIDRKTAEYNIIVKNEITSEARALMTQASKDAPRLIAAAAGGGREIQALIKVLNPDVIETLLGFLAEDSPVFKRLDVLTKGRAKGIADTILNSVAQGMNPKVLAQRLTDEFGMILTDSMRQARTIQLYSYREASRANYVANADIVSGWQWITAHDDRVCDACLAMSDSIIHAIDEPQEAHYNCRCCVVPVTILDPNPQIPTGKDWFDNQDEATQVKIMGQAKYDAYKAGQFEFSQLAQRVEDPIYGHMITETPLKDLIGEE